MSSAIESQWGSLNSAMSRCQRLGVMPGVAWATADSLPDPHCGSIGGWEGAA